MAGPARLTDTDMPRLAPLPLHRRWWPDVEKSGKRIIPSPSQVQCRRPPAACPHGAQGQCDRVLPSSFLLTALLRCRAVPDACTSISMLCQSACSVPASYKPPMLVTRVRLPACASHWAERASEHHRQQYFADGEDPRCKKILSFDMARPCARCVLLRHSLRLLRPSLCASRTAADWFPGVVGFVVARPDAVCLLGVSDWRILLAGHGLGEAEACRRAHPCMGSRYRWCMPALECPVL